MAYASFTDVRLYAPQAPDGETFTGYIAAADRVIDSRLRTVFDVPFSTTPDLIVNVSAKLAAAEYLKAKYGAINQEPPEQANKLYEEAMEELQSIIEQPTLLGVDPKLPDVGDLDDNRVVAGEDTGKELFNLGDPLTWGK